MTKFRVPTWATVLLSVIAGALQYLNIATFGLAPQWQALVTVGAVGLAAVGIAPLSGPALQNALHISHVAALSLASALSTGAIAVTTTASINPVAKGIITGILALAAGTLFGPAGPSTPTPAPPQPPAPPAPAQ